MVTKKCSKCFTIKPLSAYYACRALADGRKTLCKECCNKTTAEYQAKNSDRVAAWGRDWSAKNVERKKQLFRDWYVLNAEKQRQKSRDTYRTNKARASALNKAWTAAHSEHRKKTKREWRKNNPEIVNANNGHYRATELKAMPKWANKTAMDKVYAESVKWGMEVDHIVPLRSRIVCGLHCEANLQLMNKRENQSKGNYRWPNMPTDPA